MGGCQVERNEEKRKEERKQPQTHLEPPIHVSMKGEGLCSKWSQTGFLPLLFSGFSEWVDVKTKESEKEKRRGRKK